ncbi:histone acetylation protein-domain-containing protein [Pelagophyceae sp. CCMP2097]|nr:histone acetylation protein-domain-containing protein [Pelagophyceae sp. CCMP2097]
MMEEVTAPKRRREAAARGFHGYGCPSCGANVGFNAKRCKSCGQNVLYAGAKADAEPLDAAAAAPQADDEDEPARPLQSSAARGAAIARTAAAATGARLSMSLPIDAQKSGLTELTPCEAFTTAELCAHLSSLRSEQLHRALRQLVQRLMLHTTNQGWFNDPVDPEKLSLPDYHELIKCPMDLGTIKSKLAAFEYADVEAFSSDVRLVFSNAVLYNPPHNAVHAAAAALAADFGAELRRALDRLGRTAARVDEHACGLCQGAQCALCGDKCLNFETPALICSGPCSQKVRRDQHYHVTRDGTRLWCHKCYLGLKSVIPPPACDDGGGIWYKRDLLKRKFDDDVAEPWVQCDTCSRWVHQVCALFNAKAEADTGGGARFVCLLCEIQTHVDGAPTLAGPRTVRTKCATLDVDAPASSVVPICAADDDSADSASASSSSSVAGHASGDKKPMLSSLRGAISDMWHKAGNGAASPADGARKKPDAEGDAPRASRSSDAARTAAAPTAVETAPRAARSPARPSEGSEGPHSPLLRLTNLTSTLITLEADAEPCAAAAARRPAPCDGVEEVRPCCGGASVVVRRRRARGCATAFDLELRAPPGKVVTWHTVAALENPPPPSRVPLAAPKARQPPAAEGDAPAIKDEDDDTALFHDCRDSDAPFAAFPFAPEAAKPEAPEAGAPEPAAPEAAAAKPAAKAQWWCASELRETHMTAHLERTVRRRMADLGGAAAELSETVVVRCVSAVPQSLRVPAVLRRTFASPGGGPLPEVLPFESRAVAMFQRMDGVDLCVFSMYVHEFGDAGAEGPSARRVYIAYLDSVEYFRPRTARTAVYHELLVAYLDWSRRRGFEAAHIWACPPQRGNNFIFWCHPPHQRTPSRDRLAGWYKAMIRRAVAAGAVSRVATLYDEHYAHLDTLRRHRAPAGKGGPASHKRVVVDPATLPSSTPVCPPLFDGDYWPDEACRLHALIERRRGLFGAAPASGARGGAARNDAERRSVAAQLGALLKAVALQPSAYPFMRPVDAVALQLPDYHSVVPAPMDLGTVERRLADSHYATPQPFIEDVRLVFRNALRFNPPTNPVHEAAAHLSLLFEKKLQALLVRLQRKLGVGDVDAVARDFPLNDTADAEPAAEGAAAEPSTKRLRPSPPPSDLGSVDGTRDRSSFDGARDRGLSYASRDRGSFDSARDRCLSYASLDAAESRGGESCRGPPGPSRDASDDDGDEMDEGDATPPSRSGSFDGAEAEPAASAAEGAAAAAGAAATSAGVPPRQVPREGARAVATRFGGELAASDMPMSSRLPAELAASMHKMKDSLFVLYLQPGNRAAHPPPARGAPARGGHAPRPGAFAKASKKKKPPVEAAPVAEAAETPRGDDDAARASAEAVSAEEDIDDYIAEMNSAQARGAAAAAASSSAAVASSSEDSAASSRLRIRDPDAGVCISCPLVDSRHTFLEMCQFWHYQFDTLRRAKHSSLMLLYHMRFPRADSLRIRCARCEREVRRVRWHCGQCVDFNICGDCERQQRNVHPHTLTPYRITFSRRRQLTTP